jgi:hypothetical protein
MPIDYLIPSWREGYVQPKAEPALTPWSMTVGTPPEPESDESEPESEPEKVSAKKSTPKQSASVAAPAEQEK